MNRSIEKNISESISSSRFILCCIVVCIHAMWKDGHEVELNEGVGCTMHLLSEFIGGAAVPTFMFFSAFLLFSKLGKTGSFIGDYTENLRKKFKTLMVPYIIWNLIAYGYLYIRYVLKHEPDVFPNVLEALTGIPKNGAAFPADGPLWFMRDLIVLNILSPLFYLVLKYLINNKFSAIIAVTLLTIAYTLQLWPSDVPYVTTAGCLYAFSVGSILGFNNLPSFSEKTYRATAITAIVAILLLIGYDTTLYLQGTKEAWAIRLFVVCSICFFFTWAILIKNENCKKQLSKLNKHTFIIYATHHLLVLPWVMKLLPKAIGKFMEYNAMVLTAYLLTPVLTVLICILIDYLLSKYTPKFYQLSTGNRTYK